MPRSIARTTFEKARFFLGQGERIGTSDRWALESYIEATIIFARSVTFHLQKEYSKQEGFGSWYAEQRESMATNPLFVYFRDQRNFILKEGPVGIRKATTVSISATVTISSSLEAKVIRGKPWYRRSINILWQDIKLALLQKLRKWSYHWRLARQTGQQHAQNRVSAQERLHFDHPDWRDKSAFDLLNSYLDTLQVLVDEAEARF